MVVKENQPTLDTAINGLCTSPLPALATDQTVTVTTIAHGRGRLETRTLTRSAALARYLDWPQIGYVLRRTCCRGILTTGDVQEETTYGVTSVPPAAISAAAIEGVWRGRWAIENKVHRVRDGTLAEDAGQVRTGTAPQAMAALRNGRLSLLRGVGWTTIADALRHDGASPLRAIRLLSTTPLALARL